MCPLASQDRTCEIVEDTESSRMVKKMKKRICLVLDCLCAHDFSDKTADLINLQHYVIKEKRLSERETVVIFYDVVRVVEALHQVRPWPSACPPSLAWEHPGPHTPQKATLLAAAQGKQLCPALTQVCFATGSVQEESGWMICTQCCRPQPTVLGRGCPDRQLNRTQRSDSLSVERLKMSLPAWMMTEISTRGGHSLSLSFP